MNHLGLFEGIGGFSLAARWMGWKTVAWCEWNTFGQQVLKHHFPDAIGHGDITKTDFTPYANTIDILTGGDPCQPHSLAGERKGKDDERFLWPEYKRAIIEVQPRWIVNENVAGTVSNGVLDEKISDLEALNYSWWPPLVIPASAVGAPHRRDRVWLVAHSNSKRFQERQVNSGLAGAANEEKEGEAFAFHSWRSVTPRICGADHGISQRVDRIKALGNAIVPQVAYQVFKAIEQYEKQSA